MENTQLTYDDERQSFEERLAAINANRSPIALLLDGLQDPKNIGGIFRLADAANIEHLYLYRCGISPQHRSVKKTARSTQKYVPFTELQSLEEVTALQNHYHFVALEITSSSVPYHQFVPRKPLLLVIGAENEGVSPDLLQYTEACVHIPMLGINTSMNVTVATGIAVFHYLNG